MYFASDNTSGMPAQVLDALGKANDGYAPGYGADTLMEGVRTRIREVFEAPQAEVFLVTTGTAANALALATLCPPWGAIYGHSLAHIAVDECGAPEFFTAGAKLVGIAGDNGKITPEALGAALAQAGRGVVHHVQPGALSLTNLTECGTRYSPDEIAALSAVAHAHGLPVHLDGARFANALVAEGCTPAQMTWRAGVNALSLGGTKNGLMGVEAVVLFNPARAQDWELQLRRKRAGHLWSKHRYLSAQMGAWLEDDLWLELAQGANAMAARLETALAGRAELVFPRGGNMVFARWPRSQHQSLQAAGAQYYLWPDGQNMDGPEHEQISARLVCSWNTTEAHITEFLAAMEEA
ncbi:MAG: low specificity L-threonine aldolase [Roseinatronobacter sp.]|nr:low specificity L-threonine aldolase [Roseinatronobacter sp.]